MSGCGFPPVRLRLASGLKSSEVVERLMVSQPEISHLENGRQLLRAGPRSGDAHQAQRARPPGS
ncbi:helix-turn-helix domain-containing protein [Streptomyces capillispiralis]|uniref:helix-turn-helix domain-containing protein n=1 Tax=Streptomyces capillispiralis TaxID=68182 RepID=UPI003137C1CC